MSHSLLGITTTKIMEKYFFFMKLCKECNMTKPFDEFYKNARASDGLNRLCKPCVSRYRKDRRAARKAAGLPHENYAWQHANMDKHVENRAKRRRARRQWLRSLKEGRPCTDCGGIFDPVAMDWDHINPSNKSFTIMKDLVGGLQRKEVVLAEIAKCELVCANCHRVRTWKRLQAQEEAAA